MPSLNRCEFMGNLCRDPELKYTPQGEAVGKMSIAVNNIYKNKAGEKVQDVEFVNVVTWGKLAETCSKFLSKGRPVYVSGRMKTRSWEKDGQKRLATEIVASEVQFLGSAEPKPKQEERYDGEVDPGPAAMGEPQQGDLSDIPF